MVIEQDKYIIVTKKTPVEVMTSSGCLSGRIEDAEVYDFQEEADISLRELDESDDFRIVKGRLVFNI